MISLIWCYYNVLISPVNWSHSRIANLMFCFIGTWLGRSWKTTTTKKKFLDIRYLDKVAATSENEPPDMCAQRRLKSACASYQVLRCPHEEILYPWISKMPQWRILFDCTYEQSETTDVVIQIYSVFETTDVVIQIYSVSKTTDVVIQIYSVSKTTDVVI